LSDSEPNVGEEPARPLRGLSALTGPGLQALAHHVHVLPWAMWGIGLLAEAAVRLVVSSRVFVDVANVRCR